MFPSRTLVEILREARVSGIAPDLGRLASPEYDGTPINDFSVDSEYDIRTSRMDRVSEKMNSWSRKKESQPAPSASSTPQNEPTAPSEPASN